MFNINEPKLQPLDPKQLKWSNAIMHDVSPDRLQADVAKIIGPRNRLHSLGAMEQVDKLIVQIFCETGWVTERRPFTLTDARGIIDYDTFEPFTYPRLDGVNIVALKEGEQSNDAIVIVAHYDTVRDSPGADDNTASVAALLELARVLAPYRFQHSIILAATDMEELGVFGAMLLASELNRERSIIGVINFETMAYTNSAPKSQAIPPGMDLLFRKQVKRILHNQAAGDFTSVIYKASAIKIATSFAANLSHIAGPQAVLMLRDPNDLPVIGKILRRIFPAVSNFSRSDHVAFWELGIPAIQITDTANLRNPYYHQPTDTPETLDYGRLAAIVGATATAIAKFSGLIE